MENKGIPLWELEWHEVNVHQQREPGETEFQSRMRNLNHMVRGYISLGYALRNPDLDLETRGQIKDDQLKTIAEINKTPEMQAELLEFTEYMNNGNGHKEV